MAHKAQLVMTELKARLVMTEHKEQLAQMVLKERLVMTEHKVS
jgi:hypothetical protein